MEKLRAQNQRGLRQNYRGGTRAKFNDYAPMHCWKWGEMKQLRIVTALPHTYNIYRTDGEHEIMMKISMAYSLLYI
ncbi:hypothetical protein EVA_02909 [gut metagenome]|uniref:PI-PLC Y-box domain-containing protein n=1 Tax=gut metagenome TaxID=749906 RepID=J9GM08_9ZZZZ